MEGKRRGVGPGLAFGAVVIALAIAILIAWAIANWWYLITVFLIEIGLLIIVLGLTSSRSGTASGRSQTVYLLAWGGILAIIGVILILNDLYPNNIPLLVVVFLIFIGLLAIGAYLSRSR